jgi:hypothetical protein
MVIVAYVTGSVGQIWTTTVRSTWLAGRNQGCRLVWDVRRKMRRQFSGRFYARFRAALFTRLGFGRRRRGVRANRPLARLAFGRRLTVAHRRVRQAGRTAAHGTRLASA